MDTRAKHLKRFRKRQRKENEKKEEEWRKEQERIKVEKEKTATLEANAKAVRNYLDSLHIEPQESGCFLLSDNFEDSVLLHILSFLDPKELVLLSSISRRLWKMSLSDQLWKPLAIQVWPELEMATQVDDWNLLYRRKSEYLLFKFRTNPSPKGAEKATEYKHLMKEFSECDWYACPNGHVYLIGECRYDPSLPLDKKDIPRISTKYL